MPPPCGVIFSRTRPCNRSSTSKKSKKSFLSGNRKPFVGGRRLQITIKEPAPVGGEWQTNQVRLQQIADREPGVIARLTRQRPLVLAPRFAGIVGDRRVRIPLRLRHIGKLPEKPVLQRHRAWLVRIQAGVFVRFDDEVADLCRWRGRRIFSCGAGSPALQRHRPDRSLAHQNPDRISRVSATADRCAIRCARRTWPDSAVATGPGCGSGSHLLRGTDRGSWA